MNAVDLGKLLCPAMFSVEKNKRTVRPTQAYRSASGCVPYFTFIFINVSRIAYICKLVSRAGYLETDGFTFTPIADRGKWPWKLRLLKTHKPNKNNYLTGTTECDWQSKKLAVVSEVQLLSNLGHVTEMHVETEPSYSPLNWLCLGQYMELVHSYTVFFNT